ncbi:MAG: hypothetical protein C4516_00045 [Oxalobacter sp.]|nr:MAG: hypothetical protein C4516_00045 [Oxalobacter sp.]
MGDMATLLISVRKHIQSMKMRYSAPSSSQVNSKCHSQEIYLKIRFIAWKRLLGERSALSAINRDYDIRIA